MFQDYERDSDLIVMSIEGEAKYICLGLRINSAFKLKKQ